MPPVLAIVVAVTLFSLFFVLMGEAAYAFFLDLFGDMLVICWFIMLFMRMHHQKIS
jgi:hypothetical protein